MNKITHTVAHTISLLGHIMVFGFFVLLFFLFAPGWFFLPFAIMLALVTLVAYSIKMIHPTPRPDHGKKKATTWWEKVDEGSFPSAHAMRASGLFTVSLFSASLPVQVVLGVFLVLISISRRLLNRHWWVDIAGGILLGALCAIAAWFIAPHLASLFIWGDFIVVMAP